MQKEGIKHDNQTNNTPIKEKMWSRMIPTRHFN